MGGLATFILIFKKGGLAGKIGILLMECGSHCQTGGEMLNGSPHPGTSSLTPPFSCRCQRQEVKGHSFVLLALHAALGEAENAWRPPLASGGLESWEEAFGAGPFFVCAVNRSGVGGPVGRGLLLLAAP